MDKNSIKIPQWNFVRNMEFESSYIWRGQWGLYKGKVVKADISCPKDNFFGQVPFPSANLLWVLKVLTFQKAEWKDLIWRQ